MDNFTAKMEEHLVPIAQKLNANRYLGAIRDGFVGVMSFLIIGSMFLLVANLPIPGYPEFMAGIFGPEWASYVVIPFSVTMNILTLYVMIAIARSLALSHDLDDVAAIFITLVSFLILTPMLSGEAGTGISAHALGAEGLFVGMLTAILAVELLNWITKRGWQIKMPETVPENIAKSFSALIPATIIIFVFLAIRIGFEQTTFETVQNFIFTILQTPLLKLGGSLAARITVTVFEQVLWMFGLHGPNIAGSVMNPIYTTLTVENANLFLDGLEPLNIITNQFHNNFVKIGGSGATLSLTLIMMFTSRSDQYKQIGKLSFASGVFNINEPIIFGVPIVLSPVMGIPFIIAPTVTTILTYFAMKTGIVPLTSGINIPWTTPVVISGFLVSGWRGALLQVVNMVVAGLIYLPFFRVVDEVAYKEQMAIKEEIQQEEEVLREA